MKFRKGVGPSLVNIGSMFEGSDFLPETKQTEKLVGVFFLCFFLGVRIVAVHQ